MRRNEQRVAGRFHTDFHEVPAVQAEDRPPVRFKVSDVSQAGIQPLDRLETGHQYDVVHLAGPVVLLVDHADLGRQHKPNRSPAPFREVIVHRSLQGRF